MGVITELSPDGDVTVLKIRDDSIAPVEENSLSASKEYTIKEQFYLMDGNLYEATSTISQGSAIVVYPTSGYNCKPSDSITEQIATKADKSSLGTASAKNATSVVTQSTDLVESGAVYDAIQEFTKKVSNNEVYGLRQGKGNMVDLDLVGGSLAWNQIYRTSLTTDTTNNGITATPLEDGRFKINGTATSTVVNIWFKGAYNTANVEFVIPANHKVLIADCHLYRTKNTSGKDYYGVGVGESIIISPNVNYSVCGVRHPSAVKNTTYNNVILNPQIIDLTQLFGSEIADYIYSLEQATAGAGVAWFKQYFPNDYYAYSAGAIQSVNVESRKVVGKNLLSGIESGTYDDTTGAKSNNNASIRLRSSERFLLKAGTYTISGSTTQSKQIYYALNIWTNGDYTNNPRIYDTGWLSFGSFTLADDSYVTILIKYSDNSNISAEDFKVQVEKGTTATAYEPYTESVYPFDSTKQLRGIPKLVDNKLNYDGDIYTADGQITRKYSIVDMGSLSWNYNSGLNIFVSSILDRKSNGNANFITPRYLNIGVVNDATMSAAADKTIGSATNSYNIKVKDTAYTDAVDLKTALSGVYLVYELETPITESAEPFQNPQRAYSDGIEEFIDVGVSAGTRDVSIPVGNDSTYYLSDTLPPIEDYVDGTAKILEAEIDTKADASVISEYVEDGATCANPNGYAIGEHFQKNGKFCTATAAIAYGATFTLNTNYVKGTIADALKTTEYSVTPETGITVHASTKVYKTGNIVIATLRLENVNYATVDELMKLASLPASLKPRVSINAVFGLIDASKFGRIMINSTDGSISIQTTDTFSGGKVIANLTWTI